MSSLNVCGLHGKLKYNIIIKKYDVIYQTDSVCDSIDANVIGDYTCFNMSNGDMKAFMVDIFLLKDNQNTLRKRFPPPISLQTMLLHVHHLFLITQIWIGSTNREKNCILRSKTITHLLVTMFNTQMVLSSPFKNIENVHKRPTNL